MNKKQERAQKGQRYSTIDHHLDLTENGGFTVTQDAPFERVVPPFGRVKILGLTQAARKILGLAKEGDNPQ